MSRRPDILTVEESALDPRVTVVIATRNRREELGVALGRLRSLPESPRVIVVDNGSSDDTVGLIRREHEWTGLIELGENLGAAARTVGAREAESPYVAFSDDDSWWAPGSLALAADRLDAHARLGLIAAQILVGSAEALDPTCAAMAASPLPRTDDLPGPAVLGFLACGAVVRRSAFLNVGGFEPRFGIGGEEGLLAIDLASAGWGLAYCADIVAHHHPRRAARGPGAIGSRCATPSGRPGSDARYRSQFDRHSAPSGKDAGTDRRGSDSATHSSNFPGSSGSGGACRPTSKTPSWRSS